MNLLPDRLYTSLDTEAGAELLSHKLTFPNLTLGGGDPGDNHALLDTSN